MSLKGNPPKALDSQPYLIEVDYFYYKMYNLCGVDFKNIREYCSLHAFSNEEVIDAIDILSLIHIKVN